MQTLMASHILKLLTALTMMTTEVRLVRCYYSVEGARVCGEGAGECAGAWESCVRLYEGCSTGRCMCRPPHHYHHGHCAPVAEYGDYCTSHDECPIGMECFERECVCEVGSRQAPNGHICLRRWQKILGELCEPDFDRCYHKSDHSVDFVSNDDALCSANRRQCECTAGLHQHGLSCKKRSVGEYGCERSHHCRGGALCVEGACLCPPGYSPHHDTCIRHGAVRDVELGDACDEIGESRYCGEGLICYYCHASQRYQCVRFLMMGEQFSFSPGAATRPLLSLPLSLLLLLPLLLLLAFCRIP